MTDLEFIDLACKATLAVLGMSFGAIVVAMTYNVCKDIIKWKK